MQGTVPASKLRAMVDTSVSLGATADDVLSAAGLTADELEGEARVPAGAYARLWEAMAELAPPSVEVGLLHAERLDLDGWHVVGHLASRCATVGEACMALTRYSPILHHLGHAVTVEIRDGVGRFDPRCTDAVGVGGRHMVDAALATFVVQVRHLADPRFAPTEVRFRHRRPERLEAHQALFRAPLVFDAPHDAVCFDAALLSRPVRTAQSEVARYLTQVAEHQLERLDDLGAQPVEHAVARSVVDGLSDGEVPAIQGAARTLGLSVRTLQRRLGEAGTSYRRTVDEVRKELALRWLSQEALTADELAGRLAFRDTNSFYRAFRRWTGTTPGSYREVVGLVD